jgi:hypothetical protein
LRVKRHPEFLAERKEGVAEGEARGLMKGLFAVLALRGLDPTGEIRTGVDRQGTRAELQRGSSARTWNLTARA